MVHSFIFVMMFSICGVVLGIIIKSGPVASKGVSITPTELRLLDGLSHWLNHIGSVIDDIPSQGRSYIDSTGITSSGAADSASCART